MGLLQKIFGVMAICVAVAGTWLPSVQAANNDLVKVTVNIAVENPDYFWHYPFSGVPLDSIRVSSMGKTFSVPSLSEGQKLEFDVPKGYKFRVFVEFPSSHSTVQYVYRVKQEISAANNVFNISVKAPESQPIIVNAAGFEEVKP